MAILNVTEASELAKDSAGNLLPIMRLDGRIKTTNVTYTSATPLTLQKWTKYIRLKPDADAYIEVGGTAVVSSIKMTSGDTEYFGVDAVKSQILSVYDGTT